jgi:co-chaperonin GroES (HSP10)
LLVEEINLNSENNIQLPDAKFGTVGKVLKAGKGGFFKNFIRKSNQEVHEGDIILYWNNSQTKIQLDGKNCSIVEYYAVIGVFVDGIMHFDFLNLLDGRVLLEEYKFEKINNSILYVPELQEDEKYAYDTNNRFKVVKVCKRGKEIYKGIFEDVEVNEGDIVVVQRDILNYVDFKCKRYYTPEEMSSIEAVIYS